MHGERYMAKKYLNLPNIAPNEDIFSSFQTTVFPHLNACYPISAQTYIKVLKQSCLKGDYKGGDHFITFGEHCICNFLDRLPLFI